jgi:hypothetical protein
MRRINSRSRKVVFGQEHFSLITLSRRLALSAGNGHKKTIFFNALRKLLITSAMFKFAKIRILF